MKTENQPITKDLIAQHNLTDHELTEEQEAGILASLAELDAGAGITLADAIETIKRGMVRITHDVSSRNR